MLGSTLGPVEENTTAIPTTYVTSQDGHKKYTPIGKFVRFVSFRVLYNGNIEL